MRRTWVVSSVILSMALGACSTESGVGVGPGLRTALPRFQSIAMGDYYSLYLGVDGRVRGFGQEGWGLIGNDTTISTSSLIGGTPATSYRMNAISSFARIPGGLVNEIASGHQFSVARVGGAVYTFGLGYSEQHGSNPYSFLYPNIDPSGSRVLGNLGYDTAHFAIGTTTTQLGNVGALASASPLALGASGTFIASAIAAGAVHACAINTLGAVKCWGDNSAKQLGIPDPVMTSGYDTYRVGCLPTLTAAQSGGVFCQAAAQAPQVPLGDAQLLGNLVSATSLAAAGKNTCAASNNRVVCWGESNDFLLNGLTSLGQAVRVQVGGVTFLRWNAPSGTSVQKIAMGYSGGGIVFVLLSNNEVYYWGSTHGVGGSIALVPPTRLEAAPSAPFLARDIGSAKGPILNCAVGLDGKVYCWGLDGLGLGSFGNGSFGIRWFAERQPALLGTGFEAQRVFVGPENVCALNSAGNAKCWGNNGGGQFGLGDTENRNEVSELGDSLEFIGQK